MKIDLFGRVEITTQEAVDAFYSGKLKSLGNVFIDDESEIQKFNNANLLNADKFPELTKLNTIDISVEEFDKNNQSLWFIPQEYKNSEKLIEELYTQCNTPEQVNRVTQELELFIKHNMIDLLCYLNYLVDTMRENNILWGVGRGSSVASYVLFLMNVHKIDSLALDLDITEFLK